MGICGNTVSLVSIEAMCDSELYGISKANSKYYMPDLLNWLILEDDCSSSSF